MTIAHFNTKTKQATAVFGTFYKQQRFRMTAPTPEIKRTPRQDAQATFPGPADPEITCPSH
jgi:hypothetical protein